jgi:Zn-dependent peptidase ImmA (M78 family)
MSIQLLQTASKNNDITSIDHDRALSFIIGRSNELFNELIEKRGHSNPPFAPKEYIDLLLNDIHRVEEVDLGDVDALLLKNPEGYVIKVNRKHSLARKNFSCAHEIAHTFLHELNSTIEIVHDERRFDGSFGQYISKERLCHAAAAELLMPQDIFRKYLEGFGISINSVELLAHAFKVSIQAAAFRIPEVLSETCYTIRWKQCRKPKSRGFQGYFMHKPIYMRNPSVISRAYENNNSIKSNKQFDIHGTKIRCRMESKGFGYGQTRFVVSLVFPRRY